METVLLDLNKYLKRNVFPSRTVLVFPPFNGFRRFLIHKLIEDNFSSSGVAAFSIGQDINRRIVVCYKGLIKDNQIKATPVLPCKSPRNMIEKEKQVKPKTSPTAAVYKPPAVRLAESRQTKEDAKSEPKRSRVRRPDQQMYVPRPKRASYGNAQPTSRSRSSSRTSLESDSCEKKSQTLSRKSEESRLSLKSEEPRLSRKSEEPRLSRKSEEPRLSSSYKSENVRSQSKNESTDKLTNNYDLKKTCSKSNFPLDQTVCSESVEHKEETNKRSHHFLKLGDSEDKSCSDLLMVCPSDEVVNDNDLNIKQNKNGTDQSTKQSVVDRDEIIQSSKTEKDGSDSKLEFMETVSISSDSRGDESSVSANSSSSSNSSADSEETITPCLQKNVEKMEIEVTENNKEDDLDKINSQEINLKNRRIFPTSKVTDVLIISDSSSSSDNISVSCKPIQKKIDKEITSESPKEKQARKCTKADPEVCDWESLYDDSGECLVPDLMEELTNSVGKVRVASTDSDYRQFQSVEERTNDGECVIEIYDFPAEFKTTDLTNIFAAYRTKNFQIKWVDDTHALGVFPSPLMADEVLACTLPFVKTRPLRLGIAESRNKARNLILPPLPTAERPKTCTALARRLVSGALGLRLPTSSQEREKEKQVLKEAREKRRLEAKQREAAWDGTLTSSSCI